MRRFLLSLLIFAGAGAACADELADANKFLSGKEYAKALTLYSKMANAGNPEAQFRLGEMYWFGNGTAQDLEAAASWFKKAAASGDADAKESLVILERRKVRGGEIDYWANRYDGAELRSGKFDCKPPPIPVVSKSNEEIAQTREAVDTWQQCYNGFIASFNAAMPPGKAIPQDVLDMMSPSEFDKVRQHIEPIYTKLIAQKQAEADATLARRDAWEKATQTFVKEENARRNRQLALDTQRIVQDNDNRLHGASRSGGLTTGK